MQAELRGLRFEPEPSALPSEPAGFCIHVRLIAGPVGAPGEESFDITVCTAEWLAAAVVKQGGILDARHHVVVDVESFSKPVLESWLRKRVSAVAGASWTEVAEKLGRLGFWEFEDYTP